MMAINPVLKARQDGFNDAAVQIRKVVLDYLEAKYMAADTERGTPRAEAILEITRELTEIVKVKVSGS